MLNVEAAAKSSAHIWETEIVPALHEYILIPNKSPAFDRAWKANGHMDRATTLIADWCRAQQIPGLTEEVIALTDPNGAPRTPVILMEIPGTGLTNDTVLLYGHLDKQPEMRGWREGLSPWSPVREGDRL